MNIFYALITAQAYYNNAKTLYTCYTYSSIAIGMVTSIAERFKKKIPELEEFTFEDDDNNNDIEEWVIV